MNGKQLAKIRKKLGFNQKIMAEILSMDASTYKNLENDVTPIDQSTAEVMERMLFMSKPSSKKTSRGYEIRARENEVAIRAYDGFKFAHNLSFTRDDLNAMVEALNKCKKGV